VNCLAAQGTGETLRQRRFGGIRVIATALDIAEIVAGLRLFIGAGGTMTREMAGTWIPTIGLSRTSCSTWIAICWLRKPFLTGAI